MARQAKSIKKAPADDDYTVLWTNVGHVVTDEEWRAWCAAGCPLTDAERAEHREPRQPPARDEHGKRIITSSRSVVVTVQFHRNGKPIPATLAKLSSIAYSFTRGVASPDSPRMTGTEFRAYLAKNGITAPETTAWSLDLGNGNVISATTRE